MSKYTKQVSHSKWCWNAACRGITPYSGELKQAMMCGDSWLPAASILIPFHLPVGIKGWKYLTFPSVSRISISHAQDGGSKPSSLLATGGHCFPSWKSCWLGSHWLWILPCDLSYPSLVKPGLDNDWRGCHLLLSISGNWPWKDKQLAPRTPTTTNSALY